MAQSERKGRIVDALRLVGASADVQLRVLPDFVCKGDEIALEFEEALRIWRQGSAPSGELAGLLEAIDSEFLAMSGPENAALWTDEAVRHLPLWQEQRDRALQALALLGESWAKPSLSYATYIPAKESILFRVPRWAWGLLACLVLALACVGLSAVVRSVAADELRRSAAAPGNDGAP